VSCLLMALPRPATQIGGSPPRSWRGCGPRSTNNIEFQCCLLWIAPWSFSILQRTLLVARVALLRVAPELPRVRLQMAALLGWALLGTWGPIAGRLGVTRDRVSVPTLERARFVFGRVWRKLEYQIDMIPRDTA